MRVRLFLYLCIGYSNFFSFMSFPVRSFVLNGFFVTFAA
nr:MAG TPA: hypothetical protein [Bacteriophage sp.]